MLNDLLSQYDKCQLECDGLTRVLHTILTRENIGHSCMIGTLIYTKTQKRIPLHFWITLSDGYVVDYRARMWLGDEPDKPHGIFNPTDYPYIIYDGNEAELPVLQPYLFDILVNLEM